VGLSKHRRFAIMCSEAVRRRCHRPIVCRLSPVRWGEGPSSDGPHAHGARDWDQGRSRWWRRRLLSCV